MLVPAVKRPSILPVPQLLDAPANPLRRLATTSPASNLMTDFQRERPIISSPERHIDAALKDMIIEGVRALLVVEDNAVLGLITAADVLGPRAVQFLQNPLCRSSPCRHEDVSVADIMTPWAELQMLEYDWVAAHTCAELAAAFARTEATHLIVIEGLPPAPTVLRGLLSRTRLARQLALS